MRHITRRSFLADTGMGFTGLARGAMLNRDHARATTPHFSPKAKSVIWLFMLGGLFVAVTLLLPRGVVGTWQWWMEKRRASAAARTPAAPPAPQAAE